MRRMLTRKELKITKGQNGEIILNGNIVVKPDGTIEIGKNAVVDGKIKINSYADIVDTDGAKILSKKLYEHIIVVRDNHTSGGISYRTDYRIDYIDDINNNDDITNMPKLIEALFNDKTIKKSIGYEEYHDNTLYAKHDRCNILPADDSANNNIVGFAVQVWRIDNHGTHTQEIAIDTTEPISRWRIRTKAILEY